MLAHLMIAVQVVLVLEQRSFATPLKDALKMPLVTPLLDVMILV
jgi:hypothetical protein